MAVVVNFDNKALFYTFCTGKAKSDQMYTITEWLFWLQVEEQNFTQSAMAATCQN